MGEERKVPSCATSRVKLCDENMKAVQLVKSKIALKKANASTPEAVNWIIADWYEKNRVRLLMET
jgi:hypothetical protein